MKLLNYIKETKGEMKHVSWPTKKQITIYTVLVILISIAVAFYLGLFDHILTFIIDKFVI